MTDPRALSHPPEQGPLPPPGKPLFRPVDEGPMHVMGWNGGADRVDMSGGKMQNLAFMVRRGWP